MPNSNIEPNMRVSVDHKKELRLAFAILAIFWLAAALFLLLSWRIPAFILLVMGMFAASERFFRVVKQGDSSRVRVIAACTWAAVLVATFGCAFLFHPMLSHGAGL